MAVWFSDHFGADGDNDATIVTPTKIVSVGAKHGRVRYNRATITGLCLSTEVLRFNTMKSGDRLINQWISSNGGSDAGAIDIGLYLSGTNHTGAAVDVDLFSSAQTISTAIHKTAALVESAVLQHEDAGKTLWEMANIGAATITADPYVLYDVCGTVTTSFTTTDSILTLEALYVSGD